MTESLLNKLSKRERQIMNIIYALGEATAEQVLENFPEEIGDASLRKLIRVMEKKGYLNHRRKGHCYIYFPAVAKETASRQALKHVLQTYFYDSTPQTVSALLDISKDSLTEEEIKEIMAMIAEAREKGK